MSKRIVIISTSPRRNSNSEALANAFAKGAAESGNDVEVISLRGKDMRFCLGCFACQRTGKCVIKDDMNEIVPKMERADVLVFATPIYYYEMSGPIPCSWRIIASGTCISSPPRRRTRPLSRSGRRAVWRAGSIALKRRDWQALSLAAALQMSERLKGTTPWQKLMRWGRRSDD